MVGMGGGGQVTTGGEERHSVGNALVPCGWNIAGVCPVVLDCWADEESWGSMVCPGGSVFGAIMDDYAATDRGQGCAVVIEVSMDLGIC